MRHNTPSVLIYSGIDEAGYGPMMGPLCVACSSWTLPEHVNPSEPPDLWKLLGGAVCKKARDRKGRIAIADSKRLKKPRKSTVRDGHPLREIERGVLCCIGAGGHECAGATDERLFEILGSGAPGDIAPWYEGPVGIPLACDGGAVLVGTAMLANSLRRTGVSLVGLRCATADAPEINHAASTGAVKSTVPWGMLMRHVRWVTSRHPDAAHRIAADRQGGRMRYLTDLMREFPACRLSIIREDDEESTYRIDSERGPVVISFTVGGESTHLPIALASMTAKYVRELCMIRLNRWFAQRVDGLAPTAGYVEDGRRFLASVRSALERDEIPEALLVRAV